MQTRSVESKMTYIGTSVNHPFYVERWQGNQVVFVEAIQVKLCMTNLPDSNRPSGETSPLSIVAL